MKSRRGISSVVGAVFAIIALGTTIGYVTYSMTTLDSYNQAVLARNQQIADVANEKFQLSSVAFANNKLNITILNTGSLPINITKIWISNQTTSSCNTYSCNINYNPGKVVSPGFTKTNIGQLMSGSLDLNKPYNVKLITSRGNMIQFNVNSVGTAPLDIQLYSLPSNIAANYTTELVMVVRNNGTGTLTNLSAPIPSWAGPATVVRPSAVTTPANYTTLSPGSTAVFKWDVALTGSADQYKTFTASLNRGFPGNTATTTVYIGTKSHVGAYPLYIKLTAAPPTLPSGFKTQLIMVVTNNGTDTLTNLIPTLALQPGSSATCTADPVTPTSYDTLSRGSTAIFTWSVKVTGISDGQSCSYGAYLQNGYTKNYANATLSETLVTFGSTNLAQNTGILTLNYTTFRWTQGTTWNTGWSFAQASNTAIKVNMTNNNSTSDFYISANTQIYVARTSAGNAGQFFIVNTTSSLSPLTLQAYTCGGSNDYCIKIPAGKSITVYFGAKTKQSTTQTSLGFVDNFYTIMLLYGKFSTSQAAAGNSYAQSLPYIALVGT